MTENQRQYDDNSAPATSAPGMKPLSVAEAERLTKLEAIIRDNFLAFYAVGSALKEIRDSNLYRETHRSFEAYCKEVWETGRRTAYQYINAVGAFENVRNCAQKIELPLPANEAQVRPLTRQGLSADDQITCWKMACNKAAAAGRHVTAHYAEEAVVEFLGGRAKRQLSEARKTLNDEELTMEFKRAMSPVLQVIHNAAEQNWRGVNRQKIIELIDSLRSIVIGEGK